MELQTVFYIMAIIFMSIMFILMIAAITAVIAIKRKIDMLHRTIEEKINTVTSIVRIGEELIEKARSTFKHPS